MNSQESGRTVVRALEELRVHPAVEEIGFGAFLGDLNQAARSQDHLPPTEPIFVTQTGLILAGFGRWRLAAYRKTPTIECVEYTLSDEDALRFMLALQRRRNGWNPFIRIRLALQLERALEQRALINMQLGGKHKGSATLPKAAQIDVREQMAAIAGVGSRNVSKVKEILERGHPRIIDELLNGSISINRGHLLCRIPLQKQVEVLTEECCDRAASEVEREVLSRHDLLGVDAPAVLDTLQKQEVLQPGSVVIQLSRRKRSVVLLGEDIQAHIRQSTRLPCHEIQAATQEDLA